MFESPERILSPSRKNCEPNGRHVGSKDVKSSNASLQNGEGASDVNSGTSSAEGGGGSIPNWAKEIFTCMGDPGSEYRYKIR